MNNGKLKIALVTDTYLPVLGGAEMHVKNLAIFLSLYCQVKIFSNTPGDDHVDNIEVIRSSHKINKIRAFLNDIRKLTYLIRSSDIVHAHYTFYLSALSVIIAKLFGKPVVVTLHGLGTLDSSVDKSIFRRLYRYISFKLCSAVIATSQEMADVAQRFVNKRKIFLITNAVDIEFFSPKSVVEKDKIIVLSVRRLAPKNGVQYLVEAIPYILKYNSNIEFWITCQDKLESYIRERAATLGIETNIKFLGEIPNDNLPNYYAQADIVVFPSSAESTSIACLEAMSMEKAVLASALSAYKDLLGREERGLLVNLFDRDTSDYNAPLQLPEEKIKLLGDKILKLANDKQLRLDLGVAARTYVVANYDWRVITKKIVDIYTSLIK